ADNKQLPKKHQLLIEFDDSSFLSASIQMYGGILCFNEGESDSMYYAVAKEKPSPITKEFNEEYFNSIISAIDLQNKSTKYVLATEQRIPGLGNGVLQDILFAARIHPKRKTETLSNTEKGKMYHAIKAVLKDMIDHSGRDTEKDLFGNNGGYITKLSKNTAGQPCGNCGSAIVKENYMGGSIYYCGICQELK
ncbi:MAG: endonuclease VIII, partial [Dehalococcoidia bacterium]